MPRALLANPLVAALLVGVLALAACSSTVTPSGPAGTAATTGTPEATSDTTPTAPPDTASPDVTQPAPTPTAAEPTPGPSDNGLACTGTEGNRSFYLQAAGAMGWDVYCPVLPAGWNVDEGSYRLANGGHLEITYRGPSNTHLALAEGYICSELGTDVDACAPRDAIIGPATMGDRVGVLGRLSNGLVLDVDRGGNPSWRVTGLGLSDEAFVAICAAIVRVEVP
jgi:hypothetical protein